jgi:hypothetical protein
MELNEAIEHAIDGNCVLFVGAGFSRSAKNIDGQSLKTGGQLAEFLGQKCGLLEPASLEDVSELYIEKYGKTNLLNLLTRQFQISKISPEHATFGQVPWKRIYTTNYDNVIELSYRNNGHPIIPITLKESIRRVHEASAQCVHINGFINDLTEDTLFTDFKLTDTSNSSSALVNSAWSMQLRHDIAAANAVLFVGYSAYDLDIKRILLASPEWSRKTFFIVGANPTELVRHKLSKFGRVEEEDTASLSEKICSILRTYTPCESTRVLGRYVIQFEPSIQSRNPRDKDVLDLFLWGKINREFVWGAITGSSDVPYVCGRAEVYRCIQMLEDGERDIVVRSDLGNGKSVFLECLGAMAMQFGYNVLHLENQGSDSVGEVEALAHADQKTLLLVDSYTSLRPEVEALAHHRSDQLQVVFAARTLKHDVAFSWLQDQLCVDSIPEIDLDRLSEKDIEWFCDALDTYGWWGDRAEWSQTRKLNFLRDECEQRVSNILLSILNSQAIVEKLKTVIHSISSTSRSYLEVAASILSLSILEIGTNLEMLSNLVATEILNQAAFRTNEGIRELLDFNNDRITAKSSVIGRHILMSSIDPDISVSALGTMAANADKLSANGRYYTILRELMRFSNVQSILPTQGKMNAVIVYYERLKNLGACKKNPHFWLQYAIARLALGHYQDARIKLATAYSHAETRLGYDTFMLDNTSARLELEELIASPTADRGRAMEGFRKARTILNDQVSMREKRHYPFRVAARYAPFLAAHRLILTNDDREEIARASRFILRRIDGLSNYRANHRYVVDCRHAMKQILEENPTTNA